MIDRNNILITGGAGFIGSHVVRHWVNKYPSSNVVNLDKLTYAGNLENLKDIENAENYQFIKGDIADSQLIFDLFRQYRFNSVIHLAAESHVDRSIMNPNAFIESNVLGTTNLLNASLDSWGKTEREKHVFFHVSTDEVFGSLGAEGYFDEDTPYDPRSPYSASKASSDHMVRAYFHTFGLPVKVSNCSNNYGPYQFPEKLIPLMINNIKNRETLPVYGEGQNIRDWLFVTDHVKAIDTIFHHGGIGETYTVGGRAEQRNIELVLLLCRIMDKKLGRSKGESEQLITFVKDRAGHDQRYAIDPAKIENQLGWQPSVTFDEGLNQTVDWYLQNEEWLNNVTTCAYQQYYERQYGSR